MSIMDNQDYINISWEDHSKSFISQISNDMQQDILKDVTLACADGKCIRAHRLILSIYSEYFQELLSKCTSSEPTILLPDIDLTDLETLITFMYTGKVNITEENLPTGLKAATQLQIKGLIDNKPDIQEGPSAKKRRIEYDSDDSLQSLTYLPEEKEGDNQPLQEANPVFPYMQWLMMNQMQNIQPPLSMIPQLPGALPNVPQSVAIEDSGKNHYECNICHRFFDKSSSLTSHTRYNHLPMKSPKYCCDIPFLTRWDLKLHKTGHSATHNNNSRTHNMDMSRSILEDDSDSESKLVIDI